MSERVEVFYKKGKMEVLCWKYFKWMMRWKFRRLIYFLQNKILPWLQKLKNEAHWMCQWNFFLNYHKRKILVFALAKWRLLVKILSVMVSVVGEGLKAPFVKQNGLKPISGRVGRFSVWTIEAVYIFIIHL